MTMNLYRQHIRDGLGLGAMQNGLPAMRRKRRFASGGWLYEQAARMTCRCYVVKGAMGDELLSWRSKDSRRAICAPLT
jgi:hypothetical protein